MTQKGLELGRDVKVRIFTYGNFSPLEESWSSEMPRGLLKFLWLTCMPWGSHCEISDSPSSSTTPNLYDYLPITFTIYFSETQSLPHTQCSHHLDYHGFLYLTFTTSPESWFWTPEVEHVCHWFSTTVTKYLRCLTLQETFLLTYHSWPIILEPEIRHHFMVAKDTFSLPVDQEAEREEGTKILIPASRTCPQGHKYL